MPLFEQFRGDQKEFTVTVHTEYDADARVLFAVKLPSEIVPEDVTDASAVIKIDATSADAVDNGDGTVTYTFVITPDLIDDVAIGQYKAEVSYVNGDDIPVTFEHFDYLLKADINQRP